jgi:hypothetical protein
MCICFVLIINELTISAEDPTILSGTLRSTLDVFDEYEDHEIVSLVLLLRCKLE